MHTAVLLIPTAILAVLGIATARTLLLRRRSPGPPVEFPSVRIAQTIDPTTTGSRLAAAVGCATVSRTDAGLVDKSQFSALHELLAGFYPLVHNRLEIRHIGEMNLVYVWKGTDQSLEPALLTAHQDVVPADDGDQWIFPPFAGTVADGYVWGRGSFDAKAQMIAILEAAERLLASGFQPARTWCIAFGCDEEIRGAAGASLIAKTFREEGLRFAFVLDEGGVVADGFISHLDHPVAVVGVAEKGDANIKLSCNRAGGHSSSPDNPTALGVLGTAIGRLESAGTRARLTPPVRSMLRTLGKQAPFFLSLVFANLWLFKPLVLVILGKNPTTNALIRTTHAVTMARGSDAPNIISETAEATVNVRLLPGDTVDRTIRWMEKTIKDKRISLSVLEESVPSRTTDTEGKEFKALARTIGEVFPEALVSPYLMTGATDALWYEQVCDHVFRFTPASMNGEELKRMHNRNERFSLDNLAKAIEFYMLLIRSL